MAAQEPVLEECCDSSVSSETVLLKATFADTLSLDQISRRTASISHRIQASRTYLEALFWHRMIAISAGRCSPSTGLQMACNAQRLMSWQLSSISANLPSLQQCHHILNTKEKHNTPHSNNSEQRL